MASAVAAAVKKVIKLRTIDGEEFAVAEEAVMMSETIRSLITADCASDLIPLPNVTARCLARVHEYCSKHLELKAQKDANEEEIKKREEEMKKWDAEFMTVDLNDLYDLLMAANYLEIKGLLELAGRTVAEKIKGKTVDQIRETFNIKNDFAPEEEEKIREENKWAFT